MLLQMGLRCAGRAGQGRLAHFLALLHAAALRLRAKDRKITNTALFSYNCGVEEMTIIKDPGVGLRTLALSLCNNYSLTTSLHFAKRCVCFLVIIIVLCPRVYSLFLTWHPSSD